MPRVPCTGRWCTAKTTPSPWRERHDLDARLHARALLGQHELAAGEVAPGSDSRIATCSGNDVLAVEVLVQAVVVAGAVSQQQRRRPRLAGRVAAREEVGVRAGIARRRCPSPRSSGWRSARAADRAPSRKSATSVGQRIAEVLVLAAPEAVPRHHDAAAKRARRRRTAPAIARHSSAVSSPSMTAQPCASRSRRRALQSMAADPAADDRRIVVRAPSRRHAAPSRSSSARLRSTPQR